MGGLMVVGSSAPPPPDPNPSVDIKNKKKKKKKKKKKTTTKKIRTRILSEIGSSQDQDQDLSQAEIGNQDKSGAKEEGDEGGEAGSSRNQDQHLSQAENAKRDESGAGKDGDEKGKEIQDEEKGEVANVVTPEALWSATMEKTDPAPGSSSPPLCPICYEVMDSMDMSFHPCKCGFKLCLFCYNRIAEQGDGLCPGCRISYDSPTGNGGEE